MSLSPFVSLIDGPSRASKGRGTCLLKPSCRARAHKGRVLWPHLTSHCALARVSIPQPLRASRELEVGGSQVHADERAAGHNRLAAHKKMAHVPGRTENEPCHGVRDVGDIVGWEDGDVGRRPHRLAAQIGPPQAPRSARSGKLERFAGRKGLRLSRAKAGEKQRLLQLRKKVTAFA